VRISWTALAVSHLRSAYEYIAEDNPKAADTILERIFSAVEFLEKHPLLGRPGRVEGTRELVILGTPLIVACRPLRGRVEVLAVLHAARKWPEQF
jgi:toxin ParE1/3/4